MGTRNVVYPLNMYRNSSNGFKCGAWSASIVNRSSCVAMRCDWETDRTSFVFWVRAGRTSCFIRLPTSRDRSVNRSSSGLTAKVHKQNDFGYDVVKEPQIVRQLIGVTGQYASVDESLSATENLIIFSRLLGLGRAEARRKAAELLEEFGFHDCAVPAHLSL